MSDEIHSIIDTEETAEAFLRRMGRPTSKPDSSPGGRRGNVAKFPARAVGNQSSLAWAPASASLVIWGAGQLINGQRSLALLFFCLEVLVASALYGLTRAWESFVWLGSIFSIDEPTLAAGAFYAGGVVPVLAAVGVVQAYVRAAGGWRSIPYNGPWPLPCVMSTLIPGWGQILLGRIVKAGLLLTTWGLGLYVIAVGLRWPGFWSEFDQTSQAIAGVPFSLSQMIAMAVVGMVWGVGIYDALVTARRAR